MQQIADWLKALGMPEYAERFAENRIDASVLPDLTDQHLKDLGIALGDRLKILRAIRELSNAARPAPEPPAAQPKPQETAERRQVTVMFSDLVGSTALSARMDAEDLREVISAYQKCVAETVQRFAGFVAKYMGDGVLIYFGYPQAHEDDAERAVRAGLELVAAVGGLKTHAALQARVGIATGLVVVGDLIGSGASQEQAIVGETPNLAARLQGVAEPNSVVVAESTRKLVGNLFELHDLGAHDLKGISGPARAWAALRPSSIESRFEALHAGELTELVGREEELELLLGHWSKANTGQGQVVLLSGEAGIGKSRLTAALLERLTAEPHTRLRYFCSPQHTDSALYPIISQMQRAAGFTHDDNTQAKLMYALAIASAIKLFVGDCVAEIHFLDELAMLAEERGATHWRINEQCCRGCLLTLSGNPSDAIQMLTMGITALRSIGATTSTLLYLPWLALAYAQLGKSDEAWRCISEALTLIEQSDQRITEAEVHRVAGEIVLASVLPDEKKAEEHFAYALAVARQQEAKSWELRAAMSLARLWRDQGKVPQARELLAPVYGWFTEGFDTRDLKDAKALLEELA